jgi:hypothetical protein
MSKEIVERAKADLAAAGFNLSGNDGAFLITMEAASRIPNAGVVDKPNGNHAAFLGKFYSVDGIMFPDGTFYDVLVDGGGESRPVWNQGGNIDPARWRKPVSILLPDGGTPGSPVEHPPEVGADLGSFIEDVRQSLARIERVQAGQTNHAELAKAVETIQEEIKQLRLTQLATRPAPVYKGSIFGVPVTLRPDQ